MIHRLPRPRSRRRGQNGQRGQALVEFTFFFLALMLLLALTVDLGTLLDDHMDVVYAARQGARTGAVLGTNASSDCAIVDAVQSALLNQPNFTLTRIVIYDADANGANTLGKQDVYTGPFTPGSCGSASSIGWPASSRNDTAFTEDSIGVEVDYSYQFEFNFYGGGAFGGSDHAVFPISPPS